MKRSALKFKYHTLYFNWYGMYRLPLMHQKIKIKSYVPTGIVGTGWN